MTRLGRVFNLEVFIDWSLLVLIGLLALSFSPSVAGPLGIVAGVVYALLLVASIFAHEMGHVTVGRMYGVGFHRITLYMFGGAAHMSNQPRTPKGEFLMAIAGPAVSAAIGIVGMQVGSLIGGLPGMVLYNVAYINLFLGLFNLLPGFPLDGGRIVRAAIWHVKGDFYRATEIAAKGGMAVGYGMIGAGVLMALGVPVPFFGSGLLSGVWIGVLGYLISMMAKREAQSTALGRSWR